MTPTPDAPYASTEEPGHNPLSLPCRTDWSHFYYFHSLLYPIDPHRPLSKRERRRRLSLVLAGGLSLIAVAVVCSSRSCSQQHADGSQTALQRHASDADCIPARASHDNFYKQIASGFIAPQNGRSLIPSKPENERQSNALEPEVPHAIPEAQYAQRMHVAFPAGKHEIESDNRSLVTPNAPYLPEQATETVQKLCDLHAALTHGVTFEKYNAIVEDVLPSAQRFMDTNEAYLSPHLAMVLRDAIGCYSRVKVIWNDALFGQSPQSRNDALALLKIARGPLWETGFANIQTAKHLIGVDAADRSLAIQQLLDDPQRMRMEATLHTATLALQSQNGLMSAANATAEIDLASLRRTAEELRRQVSATEHEELLEDFLKLTRPREWSADRGKKFWGDPISIRQSSIRLSGNKGDGWVDRPRLSAASQAVFDRIASLSLQVQALFEAHQEAKASH